MSILIVRGLLGKNRQLVEQNEKSSNFFQMPRRSNASPCNDRDSHLHPPPPHQLHAKYHHHHREQLQLQLCLLQKSLVESNPSSNNSSASHYYYRAYNGFNITTNVRRRFIIDIPDFFAWVLLCMFYSLRDT